MSLNQTQNVLQYAKGMQKRYVPGFFGDWVKCRRKALDLTQGELAKRVGCSVGALRKIESGDRKPSKQLSGLLAKALEISEQNIQTFIRVSRGDLNLERLSQPDLDILTPIPELSSFEKPLEAVVPWHRANPPPSYIPSQTTPMIGREFEYAALERLFNEPQCHLLTLTGVGGIGKTRLALEFATREQSAFPGGVYYFPLSAVTSPCKIIFSLADGLDFTFSGPADPKDQLFHFISRTFQQRALFILDNLEHLMGPCVDGNLNFGLVDLVCELLQHLPHISILGTSRERLNVYGEWVYELHGLSVPPDSYVGKPEQYDSVSLFINNACRIKPGFQLSEDDYPSIVQVCQLMDGVPLAIELAAAWVGILSCQEIAQEIQSNLDFLTTSMRNVPERHRSLRATFDHSWKLLTDDEREALCQMSVFYGSFDRKAAHQIAGASLPLLASLCDKSLVHHIGSGRYNLHEVIRQYASSHIDDHPVSFDAYARHCEFYLAFLGGHEKSLKSGLQQEAMRELSNEIDNIRAAWSWAIKHEKFSQLEQAGRAYGWYFEIAGLLREGIEQLELLVEAVKGKPKDTQLQKIMGLALNHQALLTFRTGKFELAQKLYEDSIDILRLVGDKPLLADGLIYLGIILHLNGQYERAKLVVAEGLILAKECSDSWVEAYAIYNLGYIDSLEGNYTQGYAQMMAGLAMWRDIGDPFSIALGLNFLVSTLIKLHRYEEAKASMLESIDLCERTKNRWGMGTAYRYLGLAEMAAHQFSQAEAHFSKSLEIFGDYTIGWDIARSNIYLADAARLSGNGEGAKRYYLEALRNSMDAKIIPMALEAIMGLLQLEKSAFQAETALALSYFVLNHPSSEEETRARAAQKCVNSETVLTPLQVASAKALATSKTYDEITDLVFSTIGG